MYLFLNNPDTHFATFNERIFTVAQTKPLLTLAIILNIFLQTYNLNFFVFVDYADLEEDIAARKLESEDDDKVLKGEYICTGN